MGDGNPDVPTGSDASTPFRQMRFQVSAPTGSRVFVAGSFSEWRPDRHPLVECPPESGLFLTILSLPPGRYEYKFIVDGIWRSDPNGRESTPDGLGSFNSVVSVSGPGAAI